jgi:hypothetical protein
MKRLKTNRKILNLLSAAVEQHPDWRFHQILRNLGITLRDETKTGWERMYLDQFFEESDDTLERMLDI